MNLYKSKFETNRTSKSKQKIKKDLNQKIVAMDFETKQNEDTQFRPNDTLIRFFFIFLFLFFNLMNNNIENCSLIDHLKICTHVWHVPITMNRWIFFFLFLHLNQSNQY